MDSTVTQLYVYILHHRLLQAIDSSSLNPTAGPRCLSVLYIVVCICQSQTPSLSLPLPLPRTIDMWWGWGLGWEAAVLGLPQGLKFSSQWHSYLFRLVLLGLKLQRFF